MKLYETTDIPSIVKWTLIFLISGGILIQLLLIFVIGDRFIGYEWGSLVGSLLLNGTYSFEWPNWETGWLPSAYMPPLYPLFLWGNIKVLEPNITLIDEVSQTTIIWIEIFQLAVWLGCAYFVYKTARLIVAQQFAALWSVVIFLYYPLSLVMPAQISSTSIYTLPFIALIYVCLRAWISKREAQPNPTFEQKWYWPIIVGGLLGVYTLGRAEAILYIPLVGILVFWRVGVRGVLLFGLTCLLVLLPLFVRNWIVFGKPTSLTISSGINLYRGQNSNATSDGYFEFSDEVLKAIGQLPQDERFEPELDTMLRQEAIKFMLENPQDVLQLAIDKMFALWVYEAEPSYDDLSYVRSPLYTISWLVTCILAIYGMFISRWRGLLILGVSLLGTTLTSAIFFSLPRYRLHLLPILAIYAGVALAYIVQEFYVRFSSRLGTQMNLQ